jgi:hypothetical protein
MWEVRYDDGTSLTTGSEPIAQSLAEAERQRGRQVTVRRLDDDVDSAPESEPEPSPVAEPARAPEPAPFPEPAPAVLAPARAARPARRRRLLLYPLAAASIVIAAALADHWHALPSVGATTSSSPAQVSGTPHRPQLLPPLDQAPVMHFSNTARGG